MKAQSRATKKWDEKNKVTAKTYKLKLETVEAFAEACEENEKSQAEVLTRLMENYAQGKCFCKHVKGLYDR